MTLICENLMAGVGEESKPPWKHSSTETVLIFSTPLFLCPYDVPLLQQVTSSRLLDCRMYLLCEVPLDFSSCPQATVRSGRQRGGKPLSPAAASWPALICCTRHRSVCGSWRGMEHVTCGPRLRRLSLPNPSRPLQGMY